MYFPSNAFIQSSEGWLVLLAIAIAANIVSVSIFEIVGCRRATRRNFALMQQLAEATTEGIVVAKHGCIVSVNRRNSELCGIPPSELIGKHVVGDLIDMPIESSGEALLPSASGVGVPVSVTRKRLATGDDVYAIHDLSEQRAAERE